MSASDTPRHYEDWRTASHDRAEDAAYNFGFHLIRHCRHEALRQLESAAVPNSPEEFRAQVATAVDTALHNVMDLLEGFWSTEAGPNHTTQYALSVCVAGAGGKEVERIEISPCQLDLTIGYWKWKEGEFR